jgi:hypothetical protein
MIHSESLLPGAPVGTAGELSSGLLFMLYGDKSSQLTGGDTHGTGVRESKAFEVELERV